MGQNINPKAFRQKNFTRSKASHLPEQTNQMQASYNKQNDSNPNLSLETWKY